MAELSLTAFAGARRTDSAMQQFVNFSEPDDGAFLFGNVNNPPVAPGMPARSLELLPGEQRVVDLPQVAEHFQMPYLYLTSSRSGFSGASLNAIGASGLVPVSERGSSDGRGRPSTQPPTSL